MNGERHETSLAAREREVAEHRLGAVTNADEIEPKLARALSALSFELRQAEQHGEALAAAEEAVAIGRKFLVAGRVEVDRPLSTAMANLVNAAVAAGQPERALAAVRHTVDVLHRSVAADRDTFEKIYARQLFRYSSALRTVDPPTAVTLATESVAIWRRHTDKWQLDSSLQNLQACLEAAGRADEARAAYRERFASLTADSPVEEADITIRTYNLLKRQGCHRLGDVARLSMRDILYARGGTRWVIEELNDKLALAGLESLAPGPVPYHLGVPGLPEHTFGALCVQRDAGDTVAQIRAAVVAAYAADGVRQVDRTTHLELFVEGERGFDRGQELNPADRLGSDLVVVMPESAAWVGVYSASWELAPQGRHPLAVRLSSRWAVLSIAATEDAAYEICRYEAGQPVQYAAHGRPAGPAPVAAQLDFEQLAAASWLPTSADELRAGFGYPELFGNLIGLPTRGIRDLLEGWPIYDPGEGDTFAVFLWRDPA